LLVAHSPHGTSLGQMRCARPERERWQVHIRSGNPWPSSLTVSNCKVSAARLRAGADAASLGPCRVPRLAFSYPLAPSTLASNHVSRDAAVQDAAPRCCAFAHPSGIVRQFFFSSVIVRHWKPLPLASDRDTQPSMAEPVGARQRRWSN
jgi:hypothetical protein